MSTTAGINRWIDTFIRPFVVVWILAMGFILYNAYTFLKRDAPVNQKLYRAVSKDEWFRARTKGEALLSATTNGKLLVAEYDTGFPILSMSALPMGYARRKERFDYVQPAKPAEVHVELWTRDGKHWVATWVEIPN